MRIFFSVFLLAVLVLPPLSRVRTEADMQHDLLRSLAFTTAPQKGGNAGTVGNSLYNNLRVYWGLDEASGSRAALFQAASLTLSDNNTVTQATGKIGAAGQFTAANSEYLSVADNAAISFNNADFTITLWVYMDTEPAGGAIILTKGTHSDASNVEYSLRYNGTAFDRFRFLIGNGSTNIGISADTFGAPTTATWYFIACVNDATGDQIKISVNNGAFNQATQTGPIDGTNALRIGANNNDTLFWDGRVDAVSIWGRQLTAAELTYLYNSGNGRPSVP